MGYTFTVRIHVKLILMRKDKGFVSLILVSCFSSDSYVKISFDILPQAQFVLILF